jgi:hypothetical protein
MRTQSSVKGIERQKIRKDSEGGLFGGMSRLRGRKDSHPFVKDSIAA